MTDLSRFVEAQADGLFEQALGEIERGRKTSHWMWFVFPQIAGLGQSPTARHYAIRSIDEARAYLADPVLGARLRRCLVALAALPDPDPQAVFGGIDAVKLRSSLTLFEAAGGGEAFGAAIDRWYGGERDVATTRLIG
ncbi:DUF1810 domain-containing protein [Sphingomonas sp.]|uniref:DUF1810 domain-containing protein n=1 Tax=Sphingomonas sp. TaxID=28214 RepID=UPI003AFFF9B3